MPDFRRSDGFLATAKRLCSSEGGLEPTQDDLRTADGRCYYAVLHKLSEMTADDFAGREGDPDRFRPVRVRPGRSVPRHFERSDASASSSSP